MGEAVAGGVAVTLRADGAAGFGSCLAYARERHLTKCFAVEPEAAICLSVRIGFAILFWSRRKGSLGCGWGKWLGNIGEIKVEGMGKGSREVKRCEAQRREREHREGELGAGW